MHIDNAAAIIHQLHVSNLQCYRCLYYLPLYYLPLYYLPLYAYVHGGRNCFGFNQAYHYKMLTLNPISI